MNKRNASSWTIEQSRRLYRVKEWGAGYFDVNSAGHAIVQPLADQADGRSATIDMAQLSKEIIAAGYALPILVRFPDILTNRVQQLCSAFDEARRDLDYQGQHTAVYPIKVNQQRCVVERIAAAQRGRVGLEAGSKTELMAVLAQSLSHEETGGMVGGMTGGTIVCNGYKDREYIRMALIGQKIGKRIFIVIEQMSELQIVLQEAKALSIEPNLGVRIRLSALGKGRWQNTGGEKSKFGLTANQLLQLIDNLKTAGKLQALKLLHFHMGSQIADINDIRGGVQEAATYYKDLNQRGIPISVIDVGGGVGVDYEGTASASTFSINYSLRDYANTILSEIQQTCVTYKLAMPDIITETGRALTAHHAVLISHVVDSESRVEAVYDSPSGLTVEADDPALLQRLRQLYDELKSYQATASSMDEAALTALVEQHDADYVLLNAFSKTSTATLEQRATAERLSYACSACLLELLEEVTAFEDVVKGLHERLADKYFCNFSVFQSVPDVWGLDQIFPVMPLMRLQEEPTRRAIIHDITCDSDGHLERYSGEHGVETSLPVHALNQDDYYLGIFMVGAYQEILGDMHNLFGDTHTVNVVLEKDGYHFEEYEPGDRADELLRYVHYDPDVLLEQYRVKINKTDLEEDQKQQYLQELEAGLSGYTYLED